MNFEKEEHELLHKFHSFFLTLGIIFTILGLLLIIFPFVGTVAVELLLGITFLITGIIGIIAGFAAREWKGALYIILSGIIALIAGILLLFFPKAGIVTLTLLLAIILVVQGIFEIAKSSQLKQKFWRNMILTDGIFSLILGILIFLGWPSDSAIAIGVIVGLSLLFTGITSICFASSIKKAK